MTDLTIRLFTEIGVSLMLFALLGGLVTLLLLKGRKKRLLAALEAEYGACGDGLRR